MDFYFIIGPLHIGFLTYAGNWQFSLSWIRP